MPRYNLFRMDLRGHYLGQLMVNTFYFFGDGANPGPSPLDEIFSEFNTNPNLLLQWLSMTVTEYRLDFIRVSRISPNRLLREGQTYTPVTSPGIAIGRGGPSSFAMPLIRRARNASRSFNGRIYVPAVPLSTYANGLFDPLSTAGVAALAFTAQAQLPFRGAADARSNRTFYSPVLVRARAPFLDADSYAFRFVDAWFPSSTPRWVGSRVMGVGQ